PTEAGTQQGSSISPILANMTLDGLQAALEAKFGGKRTAQAKRYKINLIRYADDFIITGISKEILENEVKPLVIQFLKERGLTLSEEKTRVTHVQQGFDFLGWNVCKYKDKLLIKPSKANRQAFIDKIRAIVKEHRASRQAHLIMKLNPVI